MTELVLKFRFVATHSLAQYEKPHDHIWGVEVSLTGQERDGMIVDLVKARALVDELIAPLVETDLNQNSVLGSDCRRAPTCETLSQHFVSALKGPAIDPLLALNPSVRLRYVMVSLSELDGTEMGAVRRLSFFGDDL